jgi:hypothetical protein
MTETTPDPDELDDEAIDLDDDHDTGDSFDPDNPDRAGIPGVPDPETQE